MNHIHDMTEEEYAVWRKRQDWWADHDDEMVERVSDYMGEIVHDTCRRRELPDWQR